MVKVIRKSTHCTDQTFFFGMFSKYKSHPIDFSFFFWKGFGFHLNQTGDHCHPHTYTDPFSKIEMEELKLMYFKPSEHLALCKTYRQLNTFYLKCQYIFINLEKNVLCIHCLLYDSIFPILF